MELPEIQRHLEQGGEIDIGDIMELLEEERLSCVDSIIDFIEKIGKGLANEEDKKVLDKLLLHIQDEFKD